MCSNRNRFFVFLMAMLFCFFVITAGGCGGSSSSGRGHVNNNGNNGGDSGGNSGSGGRGPSDWTVMTGTWKPVSGDFIFYDTSGNHVVTYTLNPEYSTNVNVTISGSGNTYHLTCNSGSLYFDRTSGDGSLASGIGADQLNNFSDTLTVSGNRVFKNYSQGSKSASVYFEYIDDDNVKFSVDERGFETELDEGAIRSVQTVYFERVEN